MGIYPSPPPISHPLFEASKEIIPRTIITAIICRPPPANRAIPKPIQIIGMISGGAFCCIYASLFWSLIGLSISFMVSFKRSYAGLNSVLASWELLYSCLSLSSEFSSRNFLIFLSSLEFILLSASYLDLPLSHGGGLLSIVPHYMPFCQPWDEHS